MNLTYKTHKNKYPNFIYLPLKKVKDENNEMKNLQKKDKIVEKTWEKMWN